MHPSMLVETTRVIEFEYYFACTRRTHDKTKVNVLTSASEI